MQTPERREKAKICAYLDSIGAWYCKPLMAGYGTRGVPDILACINGRFVAIEVKAPGQRPTKLQAFQLRGITTAGGISLWGDAKEVIDGLRKL